MSTGRRWLVGLTACSVWGAAWATACGGIAVIDDVETTGEPVCFDAVSCCEAATALFNEKCPRADGPLRTCPIASVPMTCTPFLGDVYRCIWENPDAIRCEGDAAQLTCGTCEAQLEAAGEPCGQAGTSCVEP